MTAPPFNRFLSNLPWTTLGKVVVHLQLFALSILLTRYLGKELLGIYATLLAVPVFARLLNTLGLESALHKKLPELNVQDPEGSLGRWLVACLLGVRFLSTGLACILLYFLIPAYFESIGQPQLVEHRVALLFYFSAITIDSLLSSLFMTQLRYKLIASVESGCAFLNLCLAAVFIALDYGVAGVIWAYVISVSVNVLLYLFWSRDSWAAPRKRPPLDETARLSWSSYWVGLLGFGLMTQADVVLMNVFRIDPASVGLYHLVTGFTGMLAFLLAGVSPMAFALFSESHARDSREGLSNLFREIMGIACFLTAPFYAFVIFNAEAILRFIYGEAFAEAGGMLVLFASLAGLQTLLGLNFTYSMLFTLQQRGVALSSTIEASVLNLALNFLLIPAYGATGAIAGTGISMVYVVARHLYALSKLLDIRATIADVLTRGGWCLLAALPGAVLYRAGIDAVILSGVVYLLSFFGILLWLRPISLDGAKRLETLFPGCGRYIQRFVKN
ncbi:MAG: polysaccharide biosynthesis protein [Candidatus Nitrohelix vancouverensis]|uniref:Polysaccharide biosynthesis protein n=1 Tax=Candidatus Nitrohelix vancouverensis TaxID=2705534 RepID=A0A7T0BZV8_9BACT|nr:MAG: polysaccharide biosynthesis protein [Candidatus Nitrohelix vancouverensis]